MTISAWDDYLIHQSAKTIDHMESDDIDAMERLYVGCHNLDGSLHFASGLGVYPNRNVMDAYVCVRNGYSQHNIRASRHLEADRARMEVGPIRFEVLEPQRRWAVHLGENQSGITGSAEFSARGDAYLTSPPSHYDQLGRFAGELVLGGRRLDLGGFVGARDRSWGVRKANLWAEKQWGGHFWIHVHFPTFGLTLVFGGIWNRNERCGAAIVRDSGEVIPIDRMRHRIEFEPGVRALRGLRAELTDSAGGTRELLARRISPAIYFNGGGYDRPGEDRGNLSVEYDVWDVSALPDEGSPRFGLHQQIAEFELDGETGVGILEASFNPDPGREYEPTL